MITSDHEIFYPFFLLISCAFYGPKTKDKSPLNKLNGDNYHSDVSTGLSPLTIQRVQRSTILSGACYFKIKNDDFKYPTKFKEISLLKDGKVISRAITDQQGHFKFNPQIEDGKYSLSMNNRTYSGEMQIEVRGYSISDLNFEVSKL